MNRYKILSLIRLILGFTFLCLYGLIFVGVIQLTPLAKVQFVPAIFNLKNAVLLSFLIVFGHLIFTVVFGRIYCSFLCPFGFLQDLLVLWRRNFSYRKVSWFLSILLAFVFVISIFYSTFLFGFLDPYSLYGKFWSLIIKPAFLIVNNGLHFVLPFIQNFRIYEISLWLIFIFLLYFSFIFSFSFIFGRFFCNFLCPVGAVLRVFSLKTLVRLDIDNTKCIRCMKCEKECPALCIDVKNQYIDYSRCLLCLRCFNCPTHAIDFNTSIKTTDSKKEFFNLSKAFILFLFARNKLFAFSDYRKLRRLPSPPGSISLEHLKKNCVSCLLCVSHCPSKVLKPSFDEYGIDGVFMPVMNYPKSFCIYECNVCGSVCPTGAIKSISLEEKSKIQIGRVKFVKEKCIVYRDKVDCGACSEVCPTKAVFMIEYEGGLFAPETEAKYCVGCGACENVCPALPEKAIYVEGHKIHNKAIIRKEEKSTEKLEDFPF